MDFIRFQFSADGGQLYKRISLESFESHYLTSIFHCVISSWDLVKPKNRPVNPIVTCKYGTMNELTMTMNCFEILKKKYSKRLF